MVPSICREDGETNCFSAHLLSSPSSSGEQNLSGADRLGGVRASTAIFSSGSDLLGLSLALVRGGTGNDRLDHSLGRDLAHQAGRPDRGSGHVPREDLWSCGHGCLSGLCDSA